MRENNFLELLRFILYLRGMSFGPLVSFFGGPHFSSLEEWDHLVQLHQVDNCTFASFSGGEASSGGCSDATGTGVAVSWVGA